VVFDLEVIDPNTLSGKAVDNLLGEASSRSVVAALIADQSNVALPDIDLTGAGRRFAREETRVMKFAEDVVR